MTTSVPCDWQDYICPNGKRYAKMWKAREAGFTGTLVQPIALRWKLCPLSRVVTSHGASTKQALAEDAALRDSVHALGQQCSPLPLWSLVEDAITKATLCADTRSIAEESTGGTISFGIGSASQGGNHSRVLKATTLRPHLCKLVAALITNLIAAQTTAQTTPDEWYGFTTIQVPPTAAISPHVDHPWAVSGGEVGDHL